MRELKVVPIVALLLAICIVLCLPGCDNREQEHSRTVLDDTISANAGSAMYHQLFFGTWEVSAYIPGGRFSNQEKAETYIGIVIEFSDTYINVDSETVLTPKYSCTLVETKDRHDFWGYYFPNEDADVLDLDAPYFAYVYLDNVEEMRQFSDDNILHYMNGFYIKDAETLVFDGGFGLLEMRRISYPEDYESRIGGV